MDIKEKELIDKNPELKTALYGKDPALQREALLKLVLPKFHPMGMPKAKEKAFMPFLDMDVAFYIPIETKADSEKITTDILKNQKDRLGISLEELMEAAVSNLRKKKPRIWSLNGLIYASMDSENEKYGISIKKVTKKWFKEQDDFMYAISTKDWFRGAPVILDKELLDHIADQFGSFYILPSSIHEVLLVSTKKGTAADLKRIVNEVNCVELFPEERLSDNCYLYDVSERKLRIA